MVPGTSFSAVIMKACKNIHTHGDTQETCIYMLPDSGSLRLYPPGFRLSAILSSWLRRKMWSSSDEITMRLTSLAHGWGWHPGTWMGLTDIPGLSLFVHEIGSVRCLLSLFYFPQILFPNTALRGNAAFSAHNISVRLAGPSDEGSRRERGATSQW